MYEKNVYMYAQMHGVYPCQERYVQDHHDHMSMYMHGVYPCQEGYKTPYTISSKERPVCERNQLDLNTNICVIEIAPLSSACLSYAL